MGLAARHRNRKGRERNAAHDTAACLDSAADRSAHRSPLTSRWSGPMRFRIPATLAVFAALGLAPAATQPANEIEAHLAAAKAAAGFDFAGTLVRLCVAPQTAPGRDVAPAPAPEPAKVFDNLYFVGTKIHSSWALTTNDGIILIDTLYEYASEEAIVGGLSKLGLDPRSVKYVIVSHAHGD